MKKFVSVGVSALVVLMFFSGCGRLVHRYTSDIQNVYVLKKYQNKVKVSVGEFTSKQVGVRGVKCRLETVKTPAKETFAQYIKNAFIHDLKSVDMYDESADVKLSGYLEHINASSMIANSYWTMTLKISSSNGKSYTVTTKFRYPAAFDGTIACRNMSIFFNPAVTKLIFDVTSNEKFETLLKSNTINIKETKKQEELNGKMSYVVGKYNLDGTMVTNTPGKTATKEKIKNTYITYKLDNGVLKGGLSSQMASVVLGGTMNITFDSGDRFTLDSDGTYKGKRTLKGKSKLYKNVSAIATLDESGKFTKDGVSGSLLLTMDAVNGDKKISTTMLSDFHSISKSK